MPSRSLSVVLWPVAAAYGGVVRLRAALYRRGVFRTRRLGGAVISVGNLTMGGTGKTPMVLWLAERLAAEGHRPAILTRGYGGKTSLDSTGPAAADEVSLLQRRLGDRAQFGVGKKRYATGRRLEQKGSRWFILDDGFQHLALARDADIVLLDASDPFGGGQLLPAGRLREPRSALERADIVVITRAERAPAAETIVGRYSRARVFYAHTELEDVVDAPGMAEALGEADRAKMTFLAFCGIGNPAAFFYDLRRWGFSVVAEHAFRDHHRYTPRDMAKLDQAAARAGADAMICTEKDVFNLGDTPQTRIPQYACRIRLAVSDGEAFWSAVLEAVGRRRPVSSP
jgi:tetraacyldisaccharide 4'-kinase